MKKCVWTAPARTDCIWAHHLERPRWSTNRRKNTVSFIMLFLAKKHKFSKTELQKLSKRVTLFPGWRLLGHLWSSKLIFDSKSEPTTPPKCSQWPKKTSKIIPTGQKIILKVTLKVRSLGTLTQNHRFVQRLKNTSNKRQRHKRTALKMWHWLACQNGGRWRRSLLFSFTNTIKIEPRHYASCHLQMLMFILIWGLEGYRECY